MSAKDLQRTGGFWDDAWVSPREEDRMPVFLNGFKTELSADSFAAYVSDVAEPSALKSLRESLGTDWFTHWRDGKLYGIPRVEHPAMPFGQPTRLQCPNHIHLQVLAARLADCLPSCFPQYEAFHRRPFAFLGKKEEFVSKITANWQNLNPLVRQFEIRPKFELDPRIVELSDAGVEIAVIVSVRTKWEIMANLAELQAAGIDLTGLHVVRREPLPDGRRLLGMIGSVTKDTVQLSDAYDGVPSVPVADVLLEGSRTSFRRCLSALLGSRFREFEDFRDAEQGELLTGSGLGQLHDRMGEVLAKASPVRLCDDLSVSIKERIRIENASTYKSLVYLQPSQYCFDASRTKRSSYAWPGLERYGPYDHDSFARRSARVLVMCPDSITGRVSQGLKSFRDGISGVQDPRYEKGFANTFHLVNPTFVTVPVAITSGTASPVPSYRRAIEDHLARQGAYDAAIVVVLDEHANLKEPDNPYLHSKAILLTNGIPVQEIRQSTLERPSLGLQYVFQNLAVALYAKMGGIPWTVDHGLTVDDEIVIGMGTAELSGSRFDHRQRHIGITTVFRGDGNYLLGNVSRECAYSEYPEVLRTSLRDVLKEIKERNAWRPGDTVRVVFHAFKPLKNAEAAEIVRASVDEVGREQTVEFAFLTVLYDHPFTLLDTAQQGRSAGHGKRKGVFVPERGLMCQLGRYTRLLCTNGPGLIKRVTSPLPSPVLVHLHPESTYRDLAYLTDQVLKFTALSWRSTLPAEKPVTIYYSELIAELLARLHAVPDWSPAVLNTKLRTSKWFL
jgi:hypothetical protein